MNERCAEQSLCFCYVRVRHCAVLSHNSLDNKSPVDERQGDGGGERNSERGNKSEGVGKIKRSCESRFVCELLDKACVESRGWFKRKFE